jgi:uncharacterized integral membrane protein (TIGR00698 family)
MAARPGDPAVAAMAPFLAPAVAGSPAALGREALADPAPAAAHAAQPSPAHYTAARTAMTAATPTVAAGAQAPPRRPLLGAAVRRHKAGRLGAALRRQKAEPGGAAWRRVAQIVRRLGPGVLVAAVGVVVAVALNRLVPPIGVLTGAVLLGAIAANARLIRPGLAPGIQFTAKKVLRVGVALLGLRLAVGDVWGLGPAVLGVIVVVVGVTFAATLRIGRWLNAGEGTSILVATGFSICGASAVAAMNGVCEHEEEDVAKALGLVTLCGSAAMIALPALQQTLHLSTTGYGIWAGGSVHEVAQVVAAAAPVTGALAIAVAVKLTRVVLLAPLLAVVNLWKRKENKELKNRPPLVPFFVGAFLAMVALRSTGWLPGALLNAAVTADGYLLAAALFALGTAVRFGSLRRAGLPAALLGLLSTLTIAALAYAGAVLVS